MSSRTLFRHAVDLLQAIVDSPQPADKHMELYFRNHRQLGVRDRGFVAEAAHSDGIMSFVWTGEAPMSWEAFSRAMELLTALRGPDLLRAKGFLNVVGCAGPVVVQVVQHLIFN